MANSKHKAAILGNYFPDFRKTIIPLETNALTSNSNFTTESSSIQTLTVTLRRFALPRRLELSCSPMSYRRDIFRELCPQKTRENLPEKALLRQDLDNWRAGELKGNSKLKHYNKTCLKFPLGANTNMASKGPVQSLLWLVEISYNYTPTKYGTFVPGSSFYVCWFM